MLVLKNNCTWLCGKIAFCHLFVLNTTLFCFVFGFQLEEFNYQ